MVTGGISSGPQYNQSACGPNQQVIHGVERGGQVIESHCTVGSSKLRRKLIRHAIGGNRIALLLNAGASKGQSGTQKYMPSSVGDDED
ncbi:hypothetical protein KCP74_04005 [Salmonella enterica subsp. enterica]|nr:hypothetical protein KCP74_04005 [Salmonella enterica subsp. enterica]